MYKILLPLILLLSFAQCTLHKDKAKSDTENQDSENDTEVELTEEEQRDQQILKEGYAKMKVNETFTAGKCGFILEDLNTNEKYVPYNWIEGGLRQDGAIMWVKYTEMSRNYGSCNLTLIEVFEMKNIP